MSDAPNGWRVQQALSAYQSARARLLAEDPDADVDALLGPETEDVEQIKRRLLSAAQWNAAQADAAETMINDLRERRHRFLARAKDAKATLFAIMVAMEEQKFIAPHGTVSIRAGTPSVVITDETRLPSEYLRTTTTTEPDKTTILADLKQGVVIDGATLSNGAATISIRNK